MENNMTERMMRIRERNLGQWDATLRALFPVALPTRCCWETLTDIVAVLNKLGSPPGVGLAHAFIPTGGGFTFRGSAGSAEPGCIELLSDGNTYVGKPRRLEFESFGSLTEWAYMRLELAPLVATGVYRDLTEDREELGELVPGEYVHHDIWAQGYLGYDESGNEIPLPDTARRVMRHLGRSFVIFAQSSIYGRAPDTYDARHAQMDSDEFRAYIQQQVDAAREYE